MKILVIGHSIIDNVNNKITPGGVYYSALGFLSAFKPNDELYLLTSWNKNFYYLFETLYSKVRDNFFQHFEIMPEVILETSGNEERRETYKNISSSLKLNFTKEINLFDGIFINMITGFDIKLEQLQSIRKIYNGLIYFDVHSLSRDVDNEMKRNFRPIPQIQKWLNCIDILQCNNNELKTIYNGNEIDAAEFVLNNGVKILIITKAENGSTTYFVQEGVLKKIEKKAIKINTLNKIGCGDIFGATFFYFYLSSKDLEKSLTIANKAGAIAASKENLTFSEKLNYDIN
ncbi:MAG: carbohydrate kinase family protein [Melioribacteraceae bacterium]|nr:carbohydrate kinase family protein [Melioribacteraceae bacterium]